jgi:predicted nucleotidyltransferase
MQKASSQVHHDLERLLNKLIPRYQPLRVILFGSYAYGNPTTDSDLDLLIVKQTDQPPFQRRVEYEVKNWHSFHPSHFTLLSIFMRTINIARSCLHIQGSLEYGRDFAAYSKEP